MKQVFEPNIDAQKENTEKIIESSQNILEALVKSIFKISC